LITSINHDLIRTGVDRTAAQVRVRGKPRRKTTPLKHRCFRKLTPQPCGRSARAIALTILRTRQQKLGVRIIAQAKLLILGLWGPKPSLTRRMLPNWVSAQRVPLETVYTQSLVLVITAEAVCVWRHARSPMHPWSKPHISLSSRGSSCRALIRSSCFL
jgi:hypothetical protein